MKLIWRRATEFEKDCIGILQGYLGILIMTLWGIININSGKLIF